MNYGLQGATQKIFFSPLTPTLQKQEAFPCETPTCKLNGEIWFILCEKKKNYLRLEMPLKIFYQKEEFSYWVYPISVVKSANSDINPGVPNINSLNKYSRLSLS